MAEVIRKFLAEPDDDTPAIERKRRLAEHLYHLAVRQDNVSAARMLIAYDSGLPRQQIEVESRGSAHPEVAAFHRLVQEDPKIARKYQGFLEEELAKEEGWSPN